MAGRIREVIEDALFSVGFVLFIIYAVVVFAVCRLFGVRLEDDF